MDSSVFRSRGRIINLFISDKIFDQSIVINMDTFCSVIKFETNFGNIVIKRKKVIKWELISATGTIERN